MADSTWTGAINNDWNTAGNWTAGVPGAGNTATITSGGATITGNLTNVAQIILVAGSRTLSGTLTTTGITLNISPGATLLMSGAIGGAGGVTKTGLGTAQLVASNTFSGTTTVSAGTLITAAGALASTTSIVNNATLTAVNCNGGCDISGSGDTTFSGVSPNLGTVNFTGTLTFSAVTGSATLGSLAGVGQLSVQGPSLVITNGGTTFFGPLIGFCELTAPTVGGTFTLANSNSYAGGTQVNGGTLKAGSANAFGSGTVQINAGALDLDGYAPVVTITANNGTVLNGNNYAGTMTLPALASMQIPPGNSLAGTANVNATADLNIGGAHTGTINNSGTVTIDNGTAAATPVNVYIGACGSTYAVQQP